MLDIDKDRGGHCICIHGSDAAGRLHCFMHDSDPVSPKSYWLPVSLILPVQPIGIIATISDEGMKGQKGVGAAAGTKK